MKKKILITGSSSKFCEFFLPVVIKKFVCIRTFSTRPVKNGYKIDLRKKKKTFKFLSLHKPDIIFHCAALTNVDDCEKKPELAKSINVRTTKIIVDWIKSYSPKTKIIFLSTDQIYNSKWLNKEKEVNPINTYAKTKIAAEKIISKVENFLVLRINFFGNFKRKDSSIVDWLISSEKEGIKINLFKDIFFSPLYIEDLCLIISKIIMTNKIGVYNLGASGRGVSKSKFFIKLIKKLNIKNLKYEEVSVKKSKLFAPRPNDMRMSNEKFKKTFKFNIPTINQTIDNYVEKVKK